MTFVAFGLVILGVFLVLFSLFNYLQKDIKEKKDPNRCSGSNNDRVFSEGVHRDPPAPGGMKNSMGSKNPVNIPEEIQAENSVVMNLSGNINSPDKAEEDRMVERSHFSENIETLKRRRDSSGGKTADSIIFRGRSLYYEDKTGVIKYDGSDIDVDETLSSYQKFFRVGEGLLSLTENGLTFRNDAMLFHITFEEVKNFIFYQNCIVVLTRKEEIARIFFPDKYSLFRSSFKEMTEREYTEAGDKGRVGQIV